MNKYRIEYDEELDEFVWACDDCPYNESNREDD